jgi:exopolysaccharide production protein ExoQ
MLPSIALIICLFFIIALVWLDRRGREKVSVAIWIPIIWMMILGSRAVSSWFNLGLRMESPEDYLEGSPFDRAIYIILLITGVIILWKRKINWFEIWRNNKWLVFFFLYCGLSIFWSDFAIVSFKRWIKQIGNFVMILVVLTENEPIEALKVLVRRCSYILVPISVVLIKYYPSLGRIYDRWTGQVQYTGVGYNKNALGYLCLVCGYFVFWTIRTRRHNENEKMQKKELFSQVLYLALICWLLWISKSMTSIVGLVLGCSFIVIIGTTFVRENRHIFIPLLFFTVFMGFTILILGDLEGDLLAEMGRDITFTGRTALWKQLAPMAVNPWVGAGFESFWLGDRAKEMWEIFQYRPNQAHNGYLEIYLDLGWVGICSLFLIIVSSYRNIRKELSIDYDYGNYQLGFLLITLVYNFTEAAFKGLHLVWFMFLLISVDWSNISKYRLRCNLEAE